MCACIGSRDGAFLKYNGYSIYKEKVSAPKKKLRGFPHVFTLENFKNSLKV
jgi:hypothetical protein